MLIARQTKNPAIQYIFTVGAASFALPRQVANAVSKSPAIINKIQFMMKLLIATNISGGRSPFKSKSSLTVHRYL